MKMHKLIPVFGCAAAVIIAGTSIYSQIGKDINKRGVELGEKNRLDEAIKEFDRVIDLRDNESARVHHNKAFALEKKGRLKEAIKSYEEALKRNPRQRLSSERLGYAYYQTGEYEKAVATGEAVLAADPNNQSVPIWLPDAKDKLMEKQSKELLAEKKEEPQKKVLKSEKKEERPVFYATIDAMLRTGLYYGRKYHYDGLYYTTPHGYRALSDDGLIVNVPYTIFFRLSPVPVMELNLTVENPFLGAQSPLGLVVQNETLESVFHIKNAILGAGIMFTHYDSTAAFYRRFVLWDYKVGIIVGYKLDQLEAKFTLYPRALIMDPATSTGKTLDTGLFKLDWSYRFLPDVKFYGLIHARDYYVYSHSKDLYTAIYFAREFYFYSHTNDQTPLLAFYMTKSEHVSDYWGVYDLGLGLTLDNVLERTDDIQLSISVEWIERFYLRNLMNRSPYTLLPNGQGWFGLNLNKFTKGKPFPGFRALSHVFGLRLEEQLSKNFFMYQKAILELSDQKADHHEFNLKIGMGVKI